MKHNSLRNVATAWLTVVTLISAPALSTGRFICLKGMPQAGASCPRCHDQSGPDTACCKWIEPGTTNAVHVAERSLAPLTSLGSLPIAISPAGLQAVFSVSATRLVESPPGARPPQTTILRL
jgi:hypothetical protein